MGALIPGEVERLDGFLRDHNADLLVCSIATDPEFSAMTSTPDILHCVIRHCHIMWSEIHGRWLTVRELAMAMGIPLTSPALAMCQPPPTAGSSLDNVACFNLPGIHY